MYDDGLRGPGLAMEWTRPGVHVSLEDRMPLRGFSDATPFGWSVACAGLKRNQVRDEVRNLVERATETFSSYFPSGSGYQVEAVSPAGPSNGVQLTVRRGDFHAQVSIENLRDGPRKGMAVRMCGRAGSAAMGEAEQAVATLVARGRAIGIASGLVVFAALCWWSIGVRNPAYLLGGLLMVVAGLICTTALGALGAWIGERAGEQARWRASLESGADLSLRDDLKRWRALVRVLSAQRTAITGQAGGAPFRALQPGPSEARVKTGGRPKVAVA